MVVEITPDMQPSGIAGKVKDIIKESKKDKTKKKQWKEL
jgi:hypothetical protein